MSMGRGFTPIVAVLSPFISAYSEKVRVSVDTGTESNVKQSFKDEVDVNNVVARFQATGVLPPSGREPLYLDVAEFPSYQEAMNRVREVEAFFLTLPSEIRDGFENDPTRFADWATDPANVERAKELGVVAVPASAPAPLEVEAGGEPA